MSQSDTSSRTIFSGAASQQSQRPACPPAGAFLLNSSYVSEYGLRLPEEKVSQNQNQSQWSPDAFANLSFGIIMFVLAMIGLLIQSSRFRCFMMNCLHIRIGDTQAVKDGLVTAASTSEPIDVLPRQSAEEIGRDHETRRVEEMQRWLLTIGTCVDVYLKGSGRKLADEERGCSEIKCIERTNSDLTLVDEESEDITCNKSVVAR